MMEKIQAIETAPLCSRPPAYDSMLRKKTFRGFSPSRIRPLNFLIILIIADGFALWNFFTGLGAKDIFSLPAYLPSLFADFVAGICRDRAAQVLVRFGEWCIFFLITVSYASSAVCIFSLGMMIAIGTGLVTSAPLKGTGWDFWTRDSFMEFFKCCSAFMALLVVLISPICLFRVQLAKKHLKFAAEMKELCGGNEALLSSVQDAEKGDCEPTGTIGADRDSGKGQDTKRGWIMFVLMFSLYWLSI